MGKYFEVTAAFVKYFEDTAALGKYFEPLPFSNFQKQMVSGSKLKCPSKVSWEVSFSLYYTVIYGNCLGNVVIGMEKCGKICENVAKCGKMCWRPVFYILLKGISPRARMPFSNPPFSNIRVHALSFDHPIKVHNFIVLARCPSHDLRLLESIFIHKFSPNLNNQASSFPLQILS